MHADALTASDRQLVRETKMLEDGRTRARERDQRAIQTGGQTRAEKVSLPHLLPVVSNFLKEAMAAGFVRQAPPWFPILKGLDLDEVAAAALRTAFRVSKSEIQAYTLCREMGAAVQILYCTSAMRVADEKRAKRALMKAMQTAALGRSQKAAGVIIEAAREAVAHQPWDEERLIRLGDILASAVLATGLFEVVSMTSKGQDCHIFRLSDDGHGLAEEIDALGILAMPILRPMVCPPERWNSLHRGGFLTEGVRVTQGLVRTTSTAHKALLKEAIKSKAMQPVLDAVSAIQAVPLRINKAILTLRTWVWSTGLHLEDITPLRTPLDVPQVPAWVPPDEMGKNPRFWRRNKSIKQVNRGIQPNMLAWEQLSRDALDLAEEDRFYLPHFLDFRGRVYPMPHLNHHQSDGTKALFEFANGQALGEFGLAWLKVHVANCGDFEKISKATFEDRVAWVDANMDLIEATAADPQADLRWTEADAPFSFVAACLDLSRALQDPNGPEGYVSHLPVALDGSNSGVQHYSMLMRAEEGRYVNLTPEERPQDLYARVAVEVQDRADKAAGRVRRALERAGRTFPTRDELTAFADHLTAEIEAIEGPAKAAKLSLDPTQVWTVKRLRSRRSLTCALLWAAERVTRSTVKRSVMTYGYSSVAYGMSQQILEDFMAPLTLQVLRGKLDRHPFGADEGRAAAGWMGKAIYAAVKTCLPRVAQAMEWLRTVAGILADEGRGVLLHTPLGMPVLIHEAEWDTKRVELFLLDQKVEVRDIKEWDRKIGDSVLKRIRCTVRTAQTSTIIKHKQKSGVGPNVIHSGDAAHLQMVALRMVECGIPDMLLIHDSFATHAGSVGTMSAILREQLVGLYEGYDVLGEIDSRARAVLSPEGAALIPNMPEKGALDLTAVLEADYAFS